jgi:hypothetical protein
MAFTQEPAITATEIRNIVVTLKDAFDEEGAPYKGANFSIQIVRNDGSKKILKGDLSNHITQVQQDALVAFMDSLRMKAETEIL